MKKALFIFISAAVICTGCKKEDLNDPVITLYGNPTVELFMGDTYSEPGATAQDQEDGDITGSITISGSVNSALAGTYYITYTVADKAGNESSATRSVIVRNRSYLLEGTYLVSDTVVSTIPANNDTLSYLLEVTTSSQTDNRVFLQNIHSFG